MDKSDLFPVNYLMAIPDVAGCGSSRVANPVQKVTGKISSNEANAPVRSMFRKLDLGLALSHG